jgi:hypothetical protein
VVMPEEATAPKAKRPPTPEAKASKAFKAFMTKRGWRVIRNQRSIDARLGFSTGEPGMPDFQCLRYLQNGVTVVLWVEMKAPKGRLSPKQKDWILRERSRGGLVMVVDDMDRFAAWYDSTFAWLATAKTQSTHALFA